MLILHGDEDPVRSDLSTSTKSAYASFVVGTLLYRIPLLKCCD